MFAPARIAIWKMNRSDYYHLDFHNRFHFSSNLTVFKELNREKKKKNTEMGF